jgi:predicted transcriptional regulator
MKKTFAVRLTDEQLMALKEIAEREDRSVSAVIRRMIDEKLGKTKTDTKRSKAGV